MKPTSSPSGSGSLSGRIVSCGARTRSQSPTRRDERRRPHLRVGVTELPHGHPGMVLLSLPSKQPGFNRPLVMKGSGARVSPSAQRKSCNGQTLMPIRPRPGREFCPGIGPPIWVSSSCRRLSSSMPRLFLRVLHEPAAVANAKLEARRWRTRGARCGSRATQMSPKRSTCKADWLGRSDSGVAETRPAPGGPIITSGGAPRVAPRRHRASRVHCTPWLRPLASV